MRLRSYRQLNGAGIALAKTLLDDGYTPTQVARVLGAFRRDRS